MLHSRARDFYFYYPFDLNFTRMCSCLCEIVFARFFLFSPFRRRQEAVAAAAAAVNQEMRQAHAQGTPGLQAQIHGAIAGGQSRQGMTPNAPAGSPSAPAPVQRTRKYLA